MRKQRYGGKKSNVFCLTLLKIKDAVQRRFHRVLFKYEDFLRTYVLSMVVELLTFLFNIEFYIEL